MTFSITIRNKTFSITIGNKTFSITTIYAYMPIVIVLIVPNKSIMLNVVILAVIILNVVAPK
jgi:hypothetical protein